MTLHEFEKALNELLDRRGRSGELCSLAGDLPEDLRQEADGDPEKQRLITELTWLEKVTQELPRPAASPDFAHRVMAALKERPVVARRSSATALRWSAAAATMIAASLLLVVSLPSGPELPADNPAGKSEVAALPPAAEVDMAAAVRQGTETYAALVGSLAETIPTPRASEESSHSTGVAFVSASPLGRAVEGSSRTLRSAGEGVRVSVEPIASSAIDAFGFLWKPPGRDVTRPST